MGKKQKDPGIMGVIGSLILGVLMLALYGQASGHEAAPVMLILGLLFLGGAIYNLVRMTGSGEKPSSTQKNQKSTAAPSQGGDAQKLPIRHELDFVLLPKLFYEDQQAFAMSFLLKPREMLTQIFNNVYKTVDKGKPRPRTYTEQDFTAQWKSFGQGGQISYVTFPAPPADDGSHVYCTACALVVTREVTRLYTVEKGFMGTTCIGYMDEAGNHVNLGRAGETAEENISRIISFNAPSGMEDSGTGGKTPAAAAKAPSRDILWELLQTMDSCASPPLVGKPADNARWLMDRVRYFRENGIPEEQLYALEMRIVQYMPGYVADNFREFLDFLKADFTPITMGLEKLLEAKRFFDARKVSDPAARYLSENRARLTQGRHCFQDAFEATMYTLEKGGEPKTPCTQCNYTAFLVAHAWILRETGAMGRAGEFLNWALELSPENASVWLGLGDASEGNREKQLECYQKALHYCYLKDGPYGLTEIYRHMAQCYLQMGQTETAAALVGFIRELGGAPGALATRLPAGKRPCADVMGEQGIQIGFSRLAFFAVMMMQAPESKDQLTPEIQEIMDTILSSPVQKSPLFGR